MGDPVRIVDLAKDLITLSGLDPEKDIEIRFTKPRPGEKLFEELLNPETRIVPTSHEKIMVVETDPVEYERLHVGILDLLRCADAGDEGLLLEKLTALVPDYVNGMRPTPSLTGKGERILLVEDDPYTRTTLKRILETRYQVFEAANGREALQKVGECDPDLLILDFQLLGANLRRLCARIKGETDGSERGRAKRLRSGGGWKANRQGSG